MTKIMTAALARCLDAAMRRGPLNGFGRRTTRRKHERGRRSRRRPSCTSASGSRWSRWWSIGSAPSFRFRASTPSAFARPSSEARPSGILGMFNMFSGGAVERMAVFALNVMPYISASIIVQLMATVYPPLGEAEEGRRGGGPQAAQPVHPLPDAWFWRWCSPSASPSAWRAAGA